MRRSVVVTSILPAVAVAVLSVSPAEAQVIPSPYEFIDTRHEGTIFLGISGENRGTVDLGPGGGVFVGGRYAIELGGPFALELNTFLLPTDRKIYDPSDADASRPELLGTTSITVGALDARFRFSLTGARTWNRLAPFLSAGGGFVGDMWGSGSELEEGLLASERFSFGPSFLGVLGAGVRWLPTEPLSFRIEGGIHIWRLGTPQAFFEFEEEFPGMAEREWAGVSNLVIGGSLRF